MSPRDGAFRRAFLILDVSQADPLSHEGIGPVDATTWRSFDDRIILLEAPDDAPDPAGIVLRAINAIIKANRGAGSVEKILLDADAELPTGAWDRPRAAGDFLGWVPSAARQERRLLASVRSFLDAIPGSWAVGATGGVLFRLAAKDHDNAIESYYNLKKKADRVGGLWSQARLWPLPSTRSFTKGDGFLPQLDGAMPTDVDPSELDVFGGLPRKLLALVGEYPGIGYPELVTMTGIAVHRFQRCAKLLADINLIERRGSTGVGHSLYLTEIGRQFLASAPGSEAVATRA